MMATHTAKAQAQIDSRSPTPDKRVSKATKDGEAKMHKRSRSGCFTCRLRRKKCDESRPVCRACRHLNVECEYKRPSWWQNAELRRMHKEKVKENIRQTKALEKPSAAPPPPAAAPNSINVADTPPSLCHSLPTIDSRSEPFSHTRPTSTESHFSPRFDIDPSRDYFNSTPMMPPPQWTPLHPSYPVFSPYEVDIRTERQMFVNDIPTRTDSIVSTFTSFHHPPPSGTNPPSAFENWMDQQFLDTHNELIKEEPLDFNFFDFQQAPLSPEHRTIVNVDDKDRHLLDHFVQNVSRLIFPILDVNQHGSGNESLFLPALESNRCYLHSCLTVAALHLKVTGQREDTQINDEIMRHRCETISQLCEAFARDEEHAQTLQATLGLIMFQASIGSPEDGLPDIPWHQHFVAAHGFIEKLGILTGSPDPSGHNHAHHYFTTTLASWIDILGATVHGSVPRFASSYREKIESDTASGLAELMGCDDKIMYLISEIACLESLKRSGMDHLDLCKLITSLGEELSKTHTDPHEVAPVYSETGALRPKQLSKNITHIFRLAARLYLCSLVPEFDSTQPSIVQLVDSLVTAWRYIPAGHEGFDRSLVWPLLIAGAVSNEHTSFRTVFEERRVALGAAATFGSFSRVTELLQDVWHINDAARASGQKQSVHWRDVMQHKEWDCLII